MAASGAARGTDAARPRLSGEEMTAMPTFGILPGALLEISLGRFLAVTDAGVREHGGGATMVASPRCASSGLLFANAQFKDSHGII